MPRHAHPVSGRLKRDENTKSILISSKQETARLDGRCPAMTLPQRVEQILGRQTPHARRSVSRIRLWSANVALAATLNLIQDDAKDDDEEDTAEGETE